MAAAFGTCQVEPCHSRCSVSLQVPWSDRHAKLSVREVSPVGWVVAAVIEYVPLLGGRRLLEGICDAVLVDEGSVL